MAGGLLALLDDVAAIAKVAAASVDDIVGQSATASAKAVGVVIDDAAVTPQFATGFSADRELPIIGKIALGSLRNKLLILLPAALALSFFAPWALTPLLGFGGLYLVYEGAEKIAEALGGHAHAIASEPGATDAGSLEDAKVKGAIQTDFVLSAEIMAIGLAALPGGNIWEQAAALALVGLFLTIGVYGFVALIVRMDDMGLALARNGRLAITRQLGRRFVSIVPRLLELLSVVGTAAMLWVGGAIIAHALEYFGLSHIQRAIHAAEAFFANQAWLGWAAQACVAALFGLCVGGALVATARIVGALKPAS
ncbi:MAG: DUF808 domain-containing protein [Hyphomicrobiales bacterium]|nr:DUF808 domain-containing protein [Hyphomicrobiales bacterium]